MMTAYDVVVVGSGPNGLSAAIELQSSGLSVLLIEGSSKIGGGMRTQELTLPGYLNDVCSAIHPLAVGSPFFGSLPLEKYGLEYIHPPVLAAHPLDDGPAALLLNDLAATANGLGADGQAYQDLIASQVERWPRIVDNLLGPLKMPAHPIDMARFGLPALRSALSLSGTFKTKAAKGLWAGMCAHSMLPLDKVTTSAIGLVLLINGHLKGWPLPKGGSQSLANALLAHFEALGGKVQTDWYVKSIGELPTSKVVVFDLSPRQLLRIAGDRFSSAYKWQLKRYRYGVGAFKLDLALDGPIPFKDEQARRAGTVHLGGTIEEIARSERDAKIGIHNEKPFVLLAQQSLFDGTRAPAGKHTAWAYCHVPNGSTKNMTAIIENQIERFAPGFKDLILKSHSFNTAEMEKYNPNYVGGDINGGAMDICQLYTRPVISLSPYKCAAGIYICSSSTPPGGGVHGMSGYHAARRVLKDVFRL